MFNISKEELYKLFIIDNLSIEEVSKLLNISKGILSRRWKFYGFKDKNTERRNFILNNIKIEDLNNYFCIEKHTKLETCKKFNIIGHELTFLCNYYNITPKPRFKNIKDNLFSKIENNIEDFTNYYCNHTVKETISYYGITNDYWKIIYEKYNLKNYEEGRHGKLILKKMSEYPGGLEEAISQKTKKYKKSISDKYGDGIVNCSQAEEVKEKKKKTLIEHYGSLENAYKYMQAKAAQTSLLKYGVDIYGKLPEYVDRRKETTLKRYNTLNIFEVPEILEKTKSTNLQRYGTEWGLQSEEVKEKCRNTCLKKYEVEWYTQTKEYLYKMGQIWSNRSQKDIDNIVAKRINTQRLRGKFSFSKAEETLYNYLKENFNEDDIKRQYNEDPRYPFYCDFYIKSLDVFIEVNFNWTHGKHPFNPNNEEDQKMLKKWEFKANINNSKYYKNAIECWCISDIKKLKTALKNNLNYIQLYQFGVYYYNIDKEYLDLPVSLCDFMSYINLGNSKYKNTGKTTTFNIHPLDEDNPTDNNKCEDLKNEFEDNSNSTTYEDEPF